MKFYIALLLFTLQVKLCLSAGSAADTVDGKLTLLSMKDILNDSDLEKRHKVDHLSHVSCRYIKKNGYCKYSHIKNKLCHSTCGCKDVLSQKSCNIVKAKNKSSLAYESFKV